MDAKFKVKEIVERLTEDGVEVSRTATVKTVQENLIDWRFNEKTAFEKTKEGTI